MTNTPPAQTVPAPNKKERILFKDLETQITLQLNKSLRARRYLEAYILAWTTIEQFMLPRLLRFVATKLKIELPKNISELQISQVIKLYYFLSHDRELFLQLEKGRNRRNKLIHQMYKQESWEGIKKDLKKGLTEEIYKSIKLFDDRFTGKTKIPVLVLYSQGWNDYRNEMLKRLDEIKANLVSS